MLSSKEIIKISFFKKLSTKYLLLINICRSPMVVELNKNYSAIYILRLFKSIKQYVFIFYCILRLDNDL